MRTVAKDPHPDYPPWVVDARMRAVFQTGFALLDSQLKFSEKPVMLHKDGESSLLYSGRPCSALAVAYWRRLVALTSTHRANRYRGAVVLKTDEEEDKLRQLMTVCLHLQKGRSQYFSSLVQGFEYDHSNRLAVFRLAPAFAALERGDIAAPSS